MRWQIRSRRPIKAPTGVFPPNKSAGLSARSCITSHAHEAFLRAIFAPARHRLNVFPRLRAPADLSTQYRLSSLLLTTCGSRSCNAAWKHEYSKAYKHQELLLSSRSCTSEFDCVQTHLLSEFEGGVLTAGPEPNSSPRNPRSYPPHRQDASTHRGAASLGPIGWTETRKNPQSRGKRK